MQAGLSHHNPQSEVGKQSPIPELWYACAGSHVSVLLVGRCVVYFPQGHSEQVAALTNNKFDTHTPINLNLPSLLICWLLNVILQVDKETDKVHSEMTLLPMSPQEQKDSYLVLDQGTPSTQPTNYFSKTLTQSDTSDHGLLIPRLTAEQAFPPLDFTQKHPAQILIARDIHGKEWKFKHICQGQSERRHLLTKGWSDFLTAKRLLVRDTVHFIRNERGHLFLGIRRANRSHTIMPSSAPSNDSMVCGGLGAAAHGASMNSIFHIFYYPRASPSEFVIPYAKYLKAVNTQFSEGMRFHMPFEIDKSTRTRCMGTITNIGDLDPVHWRNSQWRSLKVNWDKSKFGERQPRVSPWEIELFSQIPMKPPAHTLGRKR